MTELQGLGECTKGLVIEIEDGFAKVLVGPQEEEWDFPAHMLPSGTTPDSELLLASTGRSFEVVGLARRTDTMEFRLSRGVNRRRMALLA